VLYISREKTSWLAAVVEILVSNIHRPSDSTVKSGNFNSNLVLITGITFILFFKIFVVFLAFISEYFVPNQIYMYVLMSDLQCTVFLTCRMVVCAAQRMQQYLFRLEVSDTKATQRTAGS
jgi:hypothetical protein